jgi:hypothetical protein
MSEAHEVIQCMRADYEARFGLKPAPDTIGACMYSGDGRHIIVEYLFLEAEGEIAILESLLA